MFDSCFRPREVQPTRAQVDGLAWQVPQVGIAQSDVEGKHDHRPYLHWRRPQHFAHASRFEQPRPFLRSLLAQRPEMRSLEVRSKPNRPVD